MVPTYAALWKTLTNPLYAGAYVWGRKRNRLEYVDGQLRKRHTRRAPIDEARVFIPDQQEGYLPWDGYEANQAKIAENRASRALNENRGGIRKGPTLLAGLLRCGHCGRKLRVSSGTRAAIHVCEECVRVPSKRRLSVGTRALDRAVSEQLCRAVEPEAVEAAIEAEAQHERDHQHVAAEAELRAQAAQYEADRAMEQWGMISSR